VGARDRKPDPDLATLCRTTRYGRRVLDDQAHLLDAALVVGYERHGSMLRATMTVASRVLSREINEAEARDRLAEVVRRRLPARVGELLAAWASALRKAEPRGPQTDHDHIRFADPVERRAAIGEWLNHRVLADDVVARGGTSGATALAVVVALSLTASRTGSTMLSESLRQLAAGAGVTKDATWRTRHLWGRHVERVARGELTDDGKLVASIWSLRGLDAPCRNSRHPEGRTPDVVRDVANSGIDLADPLAAPNAARWLARQGRRAEWRCWLALDAYDALSAVELRTATGYSRDVVGRSLRLMTTAGEVAEVDRGRYQRVTGASIYDEQATIPDQEEQT
jgi:hypothetical protein